MSDIADILAATSHRPFDIPAGQWKYYQEWNNALFLHWKIPYEVLRKSVPEKLNIDSFEGECYISLVAFTMQRIRPRYLPPVAFVSDFHEINVRTYINNGSREGVYFINIEAEKHISAFLSRYFSGLPYEKSAIKRTHREYRSANHIKSFRLDAEFDVEDEVIEKSAFEKWATERYCLYLERRGKLFRYDVHHKEWALKKVKLEKLDVHYKMDDIILGSNAPDFVHYSDGVKVLAWRKQEL